MKKSLVAAAILAAGASLISPGSMAHPPIVPKPVYSKKQRRGLFNDVPYSVSTAYGRKGAGISVAQQKRTAKKARNVARNRASHR